FIHRLNALALGQNPDLVEVDRLGLRVVELAVANSRSGAHLLHLARADHRPRAHAVLMLQRTFQHVGDDLHVTMRMVRKTIPRLYPVFIDHAQAAKAHKPAIVIITERKCVIRVEPAVVGVAPLSGPSYLNHCSPKFPVMFWPGLFPDWRKPTPAARP